jgi:hypothetical protein
VDLQLENELLGRIESILPSLDAEQPVAFQPHWEAWFGDYEEMAALRTKLTDDQGQVHPLTRSFIKGLGVDASNNSGQIVPLRLLFVATMMWGWAKAARARVFVRAAMCDLMFNDTLLAIQRQLVVGDMEGAYQAADDLNGCGEAFATKVLYFAGWPYCTNEAGMKHLILDSQVRKSLKTVLGKNWGETKNYWHGKGPADVYMWYLRKAAKWATDIGSLTGPDRVEHALFALAKT